MKWDLASLKMIFAEFHICQRHKTFCEKRIPALELEVANQIQTPVKNEKVFVPKPVNPGRDFTERQPNNGELIE